jgi:hypothetical protein
MTMPIINKAMIHNTGLFAKLITSPVISFPPQIITPFVNPLTNTNGNSDDDACTLDTVSLIHAVSVTILPPFLLVGFSYNKMIELNVLQVFFTV